MPPGDDDADLTAGYIARWRPSSVSPQAAAFTRPVVPAAPGSRRTSRQPATDPRAQQDTLAGLHSLHQRAHLGHLPGNIAARDVRERKLPIAYALPEPEIQVIQGARLDPYQYFVGRDLRVRSRFVFQHLGTTVLVESDCLHGSPPLLKSTIH